MIEIEIERGWWEEKGISHSTRGDGCLLMIAVTHMGCGGGGVKQKAFGRPAPARH